MAELKFYNTLTRTKEAFRPIDEKNVRMYVCGPTVYDFAHIGNARPAIVFDVLFRLLRHVYGEDHVTYARNITDVDDKINARALRDFGDKIASGEMTLNEAIRHVTEKTATQYHADVNALGCLEPTFEPRATEFVLPRADGKADMVGIIQSLLDKGHAYVSVGSEGREVLFDVTSMAAYGGLSNRKLEDQQAGARIAVESHKKNPGDFVLWKESDADQPGWNATFKANGETVSIHGRPGWHIECSAMSAAYLGETFDIHGGGLDLIFPHHENEIAQSCCAYNTDKMANIWMHNGYLQVEGKKMSKSDGNFVTINQSLEINSGDVVRLLLLKTHYRKPIDYSEVGLLTAASELGEFTKNGFVDPYANGDDLDSKFLDRLKDDLDLSGAISRLHELAKMETIESFKMVAKCLDFLGFRNLDSSGAHSRAIAAYGVPENILMLGLAWKFAYLNEQLEREKVIRENLSALGWSVLWGNGMVHFTNNQNGANSVELDGLISQRLAFLKDKNFAEADKIRDELLAQGIQLKDSKDSETGERITTWEVKR